MNMRKFQLVVLATALSGAAGIASAQQSYLGAGASVATTPAAAKTAIDIQGNAALTSETALSGTPRQGSPGTQSGVAATHTVAMGGPGGWMATGAGQAFSSLSGTQLLALQRHSALR
jgi:hypothetical protein